MDEKKYLVTEEYTDYEDIEEPPKKEIKQEPKKQASKKSTQVKLPPKSQASLSSFFGKKWIINCVKQL